MGVVTSKSPKIPADSWLAISEEINATVKQQRIIYEHLAFHFKRRVCAPEIEIRGRGNSCAMFQKFERKFDDKSIVCHYRMLNEAIRNVALNNDDLMFNANVSKIENIEVAFSGDHGK